MDYGNGAIFGCPAHDQRDFDFARKYNLQIVRVVSDSQNTKTDDQMKEAFTGDGKMINSEFLNGLDVKEAKKVIIEKIEEKKIGEKKNTI